MTDHSSELAAQRSPFDSKRREDEHGEYWLAREIMRPLGYSKWERFAGAIERAKISVAAAGGDIGQHFPGTGKDPLPGTPGSASQDYRLTRYAAYMIAMNGDVRKHEIAHAQTYFAIKTRQAETAQGAPVVEDKWSDHPDMIATRRWLETNERVERVEITLNEHGEEIKRVTDTTTRLELELAPKVRLHDQLMASQDTYTLKEVADRFGFGDKGRQTLINDLRARGILCQKSEKGGTQAAYAHYYRAPTRYFVQKLIPRERQPWIKDEAVEITPAGLAWLAKIYGK